MTAPELMPCPFCGGKAEYVLAYAVKCTGCGLSLPCAKDEAIAAWNTRADLIPAALAVLEVQALVEAVERERNVQPYDIAAQEEAADAVDRALAALRGEGRNG